MKFFGLVLGCLIFLGGCNEVQWFDSRGGQEKIWVFSQFNVAEENDAMESYYYYGEMSENLYERLKRNAVSSGFLTLENVKYWGDNDLIHDYQDAENTGEIMFRIEDIKKLVRVKEEPITGSGIEQYGGVIDEE